MVLLDLILYFMQRVALVMVVVLTIAILTLLYILLTKGEGTSKEGLGAIKVFLDRLLNETGFG